MSLWNNYVYILSNKNRTTFYVGVTGNIKQRILYHKAGVGSKFCKKYNITDLMFYTEFEKMRDAIKAEKQIKNWHRDWKINKIKELNPKMIDLAEGWVTEEEIKEVKERFKRLGY